MNEIVTRNVTRFQRSRAAVGYPEASSVMSARQLYRLPTEAARDRTRPSVCIDVRPDAAGHLDPDAAKELFNRLWKLLERARGCDAVLDMTRVRSVASRFVRELVFLRRHLRHQRRRVVLSNVRAECSYLLDIEL